MEPLERSFFARDTREVARDLVGAVLVRRLGRRTLVARVVETEAYHGPDDRASHAHGGPTPRSAIMFGPPGYAYVYLIYGMWSCLNVVTGEDGFPAAVLLRAAAPVRGFGEDPRAASGPGKLCRALGITRRENGLDLCSDGPLYLSKSDAPPPRLTRTPRIGVDYAGAWARRPWRFLAAGDAAVSRPARSHR
jgi:DNA-3-methyladenine glycosylase